MFTDILFLKSGFIKGKTEQFVRLVAFKISPLPNKAAENTGSFRRLPLAQGTEKGQNFTSCVNRNAALCKAKFSVLIIWSCGPNLPETQTSESGQNFHSLRAATTTAFTWILIFSSKTYLLKTINL